MIDKDLRNFILEDIAISGYISERLYTEIEPEKVTYPFVRMNRISNPKNKRSKIYSPLYQFSSFSKNLSESETILERINSIVEDFKGKWGEKRIIDVSYSDIKRMPFDNKERVFHSLLEVRILHK